MENTENKPYYPLNDAIERGDFDQFVNILESIDPIPNKSEELVMSVDWCFTIVCRNDNVKFASHLVDSYSKYFINLKSSFYEALRTGAIRIVQYLVDTGKNPPFDDTRVIYESVSSGSIQMLKFCINCGYAVNSDVLFNIKTPLNEEFEIQKVKILLECDLDANATFIEKVSINSFYKKKVTYLHHAIHHKKFHLIKLLLQYGANVNSTHLELAVNNYEIFRLLHNQCCWKTDDLVEVLNKCTNRYASPKVLEYLLKSYDFSINLLDKLSDVSQCQIKSNFGSEKIIQKRLEILSKYSR